jgi:hypothetical protein
MRKVLFTAIHSAEFGFGQWAAAKNLALHYMSMNRICFCAMGHSSESAFALLAKAPNLVVCRGSLRKSWLCAMGHRGEFGYVLWASVQNLVICYRPHSKIIYHSPKSHELHVKNGKFINCTIQDLYRPWLKLFVA